MIQTIINTPADSGLGDSLKVAFDKVNANFQELVAIDASFSGDIQTLNTIISDGSTLNHTHTISQIIGLQTALSGKVSTTTFNTQILAINSSIQAINTTLSEIIDILNTKIGDAPFSGVTYGRRDGAWVQIATGSNFTGGTVSGATNFIGGLSATTISATTYQNLPQPDLSGYVPYTGAAQDVDLGTHSISSEKGIYQFNDNNNQIALEKLEHYNRIYMDTTDTSSDEFGRFSLEANPEFGLAVAHSKTGWNGSSFRLNRDGIEGYTFDETGSVVENRFNFTKDYFSVDKQIKSDTGLEVTNSPTGIFSVDNENPNYLSFGFLSNDISEDEFGSVLVNFNPEESITLRKDRPISNSSGAISLTDGDISLSVANPDYQQNIYIQSGDISLSVNDAQVNANNILQILSESTYSKKLINTDVGFQITNGPEGEFFVTPTGNYLTYNFTSDGTTNGTPRVSMTANSEEGINLTNFDSLSNQLSSVVVSPNQTIINTYDNTSTSSTSFLSTGTTFDKPISVPKVKFNSLTGQTASEGELVWNDVQGTMNIGLKGSQTAVKSGVDLVVRVVNKVTPNTTLTKAAYQAVRVSGAQGQRLAVELAQANNDNNSADTIGLVCETIAPNQEGFIMTVGQLEGIDTTGSLQGETWIDGDVIYLSPTTAGRLTNVKPQAPQHLVVIGYVEYAHQNNGKIYVKIMNGWELDELHNVSISTGVTNNQVLAYTSSTQLWENKNVNNIVITNVEKNSIELRANGIGLNTFTRWGYSTAADTITGNANATATGSMLGRQVRFNYVTSTVAGSLAGFRTTFASWGGMSSGAVCEWLFGTADAATVAGARSFVGFTGNFAAPTNIEPTNLTNCVGIARLSTSNNWHIIHNDNTGICTSIDLGSGYPSNTLEVDLIYLRLTFNTNGTVSYLVANKTTNISTSGVLSTNLPAVALYEQIWITNNTTALAARLGFCWRAFSNPY